MKVDFIALSNGRHRRKYEDVDNALAVGAYGDEFSRIAFGGRNAKGRAGIALGIYTGIVSGHKIDAIPSELLKLVRHVPLNEARQGLGYLLAGEDVLIGTQEHGILLRRFGDGIEVFGAGDDSQRPFL